MSGAEGGESCEELLNMLHQRMISTGEWSSLLVQLRRMLEESGWEAQLREQAERTELLRTSKVIYLHYAGEARSQDSLHIGAIVDKLGGYAHGRCASTSDVTLSRYIPGVGANQHFFKSARFFRSKSRRRIIVYYGATDVPFHAPFTSRS